MAQLSVDSSTGCWLWSGPLDAYGHPITTAPSGPQVGRVVRVCHINFEAQYNKKPKRIGHSCNNPICVNPDHLFDSSEKVKQTKIEEIQKKYGDKIKALELVVQALRATEDPTVEPVAKKHEFEIEALKLKQEALLRKVGKVGEHN